MMAACPARERWVLLCCACSSDSPDPLGPVEGCDGCGDDFGAVSGDAPGADCCVCVLIRCLILRSTLILNDFQNLIRCTLLLPLNRGQPSSRSITVLS